MKRLLLSLFLLVSFSLALSGEELTTKQVEKYLKDKKVFFLDVREPDEIRQLGSVPRYVNIPVGQLEQRLNEVPKNKLVVTLWNHGKRAARAADILSKNGFKVLGSCGIAEYKEQGKELVYPKQ